MKPLYLIGPKIRSIINHLRSRPKLPAVVIIGLTIGFLVGIHMLVLKVLGLMDQVPLIGLVLKNYLLSAVLLCLMFMLTFSNLINALSAFFLSRELELVFASPLSFTTVFCSKFVEVMLRSCWMVVLLLAPVMTAYCASYQGEALFYLVWIPATVPFMMLCTAIGVTAALLLAVILPVQRAATVLRFVFVVGVGILIVLLRMLQPEQLMVPERFENFGRFLLALHSPFANDLPSYWLSRVLICLMKLDFFAFERFALPYVSTTFAACTLCYTCARLLYLRGWRRLRSGTRSRGEATATGSWQERPSLLRRIFEQTGRYCRTSVATLRLIEKEICIFLRTPAIWTQTALLLVIVVIYLYNIHLLPADSLRGLRADLPSITSFCNVAFIGFILTAAALRFGFPSVSMEGRALALILASPQPAASYLAVKYWTAAVPLTVLGVTLALLSSVMLGSSSFVSAVVLVDVIILSLAIAALALFFGTVYADLAAHNFAELPSGWGGMLFMAAAIVFIALFLAAQAYPCYLHFLVTTSVYRLSQSELSMMIACMTLSFCSGGLVMAGARALAGRYLVTLV